ncbi:unnamed protein product [Angiostrongylus costaricensis]|uniref:Ras-associating domain-containing protein n=1 Tax=Angiostrongylus costaricensis TaxID=334426 RepID=A0A0R3PEE3_ANGCS|nr:unnamed protein product [Angiostrongylus costaricensis]
MPLVSISMNGRTSVFLSECTEEMVAKLVSAMNCDSQQLIHSANQKPSIHQQRCSEQLTAHGDYLEPPTCLREWPGTIPGILRDHSFPQ